MLFSIYAFDPVGDGLVSQMPALIISAATGILVTRVSADDHQLGDDIQMQMFTNPKILGIVSGLMLLLSLIPGLPMLPFMSVAAVAGTASFLLIQSKKREDDAEVARKHKEAIDEKIKKPKASTASVMELLQIEPLEVEIGYRLVPLLEAENGGDLLDRIAQIRRQVAVDIGMVLPSVRVRDNLQLPANQYQVKLRGTLIETGEVRSEMWLAMNTDSTTETINGIATKEPAFGLPAYWIYADQKEEAEMKGFTVVSASAVVATHLSEIIKRYAPDILAPGCPGSAREPEKDLGLVGR